MCMTMNKSNKLFLISFLILCVFVTPTLLFSGSFVVANASVDSTDDGIITDDTNSEDTSTLMQSSSSSKGSKTHVQAKNTQQSIYNCATGQKGVIITPGNFKVSADKKNGKWHGTISIKGSTGEKSGSIVSGKANGISYSFKGNLNTKNTLCHFPGLQLSGTSFELGSLTCGTLKTIKYTELSTGNTNHFKVLITCR
jgi:hypothetical protein